MSQTPKPRTDESVEGDERHLCCVCCHSNYLCYVIRCVCVYTYTSVHSCVRTRTHTLSRGGLLRVFFCSFSLPHTHPALHRRIWQPAQSMLVRSAMWRLAPSSSSHASLPVTLFASQICSSYIDPMFSGYFLQFHSMFSLYFGWWNLDIECNARHYMYLVHQNKLMTFCGFGMKTTSFGPPSFRRQGALKKHNLYMHAIAPDDCLSPPTPHCPVPTFRFGRFFSWFFWP